MDKAINNKAIKRAIKIVWRTIVAVSTFLFAVALILQLPQVQTFVTGKVVNGLSKAFDGDITFEKIHLKPFTTLVIKNIAITDREPVQDPLDPSSEKIDTLFRAGYIIARFTLDGLIRQEGIHLKSAYVENARMNLVLEDNMDGRTTKKGTDNLSRIFRIVPKTPEKNEKEIFHIRKVEIHDMAFAMKSYMSDRPTYDAGIDWNDLDIKDINLEARGLRFKGGIMSGDLERLSFREKSGYEVEDLTGSARVGRGKTIVENLHIDDLWSDVHLNLFMMSYENVKAFQNFIEEVKLDGDIASSTLDFKTISYFAPELEGNDLKAFVSGSMSGPIDDFTFSDISIDSAEGGFSGIANGRMTGLPEIERTRLNATLKDFTFTSKGLGEFITEWMMGKGALDLGRYAEGTTFSLNAKASGLLNHLHVQAEIGSPAGGLEADLRLDDIVIPAGKIGISGNARTYALDLGRILDNSMLGPVDMKTSFEAGIGTGAAASSIRIDTLGINRLHINSYDYTNIAAVGRLENNAFDGRIICHDPNLNFILQGTFALSAKTQNARYKFYANVGHADLQALNIDKRGTSRIDMTASADFTKTGRGDLRGKIDIGGLTLENNLGRNDIGNISLTSYSTDHQYTIRMDSGFANGRYTGTAPVTTFISDLRNITLKKELPALLPDSTYIWNNNSYDLTFRCSNSMDILSFIMPGLYVDEGTSLEASLADDGRFTAELLSDRLAFKRNYMKGFSMKLDNGDGNLNGTISCDEISAASVTLKDNSFDLHGSDNHIGIRYAYDNSGEMTNKGEFILHAGLERKAEGLEADMQILPSAIYLNSKEWSFRPSRFILRGGDLNVESFALTSGDEKISIAGRASKESKDTITLNLDRFDLSAVNPLLSSAFDIKGAASGKIQMISPMDSKGILADIICDSTYIAGTPLGVLSLGSVWNDEDKNFGLYAKNEINGESTLDASGTLTPKGSILDLNATLNKLRIDYFQPVLTDVFSEMEGEVSGIFRIEGPVNRLKIRSRDAIIGNTLLKVAYTDVPYFADGRFHVDEKGVFFDDIDIKDRHRGTGKVTGSINWNHMRDIAFDTHIRVNEIEGINLAEDKGQGFYGNVAATGNVSITGPVSSLLLTVDAVTAGRGQLHIPLVTTSTAGKVTNLLRFKEKESSKKIDPYEQMMTRLDQNERADSDFAVKLRINARPEVSAFIEIDKATGNVLTGYGNGLIDLEAGLDRFNINGDYTLSGGSYRFVAMGLVSRDFQIQDGSSIRFNGDIMESTLDIDAVYRTKASLSTLLSDVSSVSNKRNVDCTIGISDNLSNPRLTFGIDIPDLNPMYKSRVESALSTEDKVQKQFLSLIVSNNFLPDEQSGIVNNSSVLYSNVTEMFANQLNNIFHKLDIPLDLGLNYQPNDQGNDLFDVAVSTQLFNNRVVVNGNIGNRQYNTGGSQNDVVGDLDIEIKIDRSGAFRLNLFSHSADQFSNYLDNSQRNGVGIMYQTEFNNFGRFIRNIFKSKAKRQAARLQEEQSMLEGGKVKINIEAPQENTDKEHERK